MAKTTLSARVAADTEEEIEKYAEDRDLSTADATRRLVRNGLAVEGYPVTAADGGTTHETHQRLDQLENRLLFGLGAAIAYAAATPLVSIPDGVWAMVGAAIVVGIPVFAITDRRRQRDGDE